MRILPRQTGVCFHRIALLNGLWFALSAAGIARADDLSFEERFDRQVVLLRSESRSIRHQAEAELLQWGDPALPELTRAIETASDPLRSELQQLQRTLVIRGGERDLLGTRITAAPRTLQDAFQALSQDGRLPISLANGLSAETRLSTDVAWKETLFWEALDDLCRRESLLWNWSGQRSLALERRDAAGQINQASRTTTVGCVRLSWESRRSLSREDGAIEPIQRVNIVVDVEPTVRPLQLLIRDADMQLLQGGTTPLLFTPEGRREIDFSSQQAKFSVNFLGSNPLAMGAATLRGVVQLRCSARPQELRFRLAGQNERVAYAGQQEVRLIKAEDAKLSLTVRMQIHFSSDVSRDSHRLGRFHREAWLETTAGERTPFRSLDLLETAGRIHEIQYEFPLQGEPLEELTLVYSLPAVNGDLRVPFSLQWPEE